jgi:hypothetical protein
MMRARGGGMIETRSRHSGFEAPWRPTTTKSDLLLLVVHCSQTIDYFMLRASLLLVEVLQKQEPSNVTIVTVLWRSLAWASSNLNKVKRS